MGIIGVILLVTAALGFAVLSARYLLASSPLLHHSAVMSHDGVDVVEGHERIFVTLYKILGCVSLSMAILIGAIALFAVRDAGAWPHLTLILIGLIMIYGGGLVPLHVERDTGVRMPWRPSIVVSVMVIVGALLSWI